MSYIYKRKILDEWLNATFAAGNKPKIHFVPHHLSHVVGSFLVSPYEKAALLSVDGWGEWASTFKGTGRGNTFNRISQDYFPYSLGMVYEAATVFCGFRGNYDEGKTMGLAPLGNPETFGKIVEKMFWVNDDMSIGVDLSYFDARYYSFSCGKKFCETFGAPRERIKTAKFEQRHLDVAAAFQKQLEECMLKMARLLHERTQEDYLVIAGGVALNSVTNGRLVRESGFKDLYVMPAAGDNGTAIGAAFYVYNCILGQPRSYVHDNPFIGSEYANSDIERLLAAFKLKYKYLPDTKLETETAELLQSGHIIGWFQGRMEFGPRALGSRSILADARDPKMKDTLNMKIKFREGFRPFAPSVTQEAANEFFEMNKLKASPFMLFVANVRADKRVIPSVTHVDGSARLQTVERDLNPLYHELISEFGRQTGVPVIINTSFNVRGEPIVCTPADAYRCFMRTNMDHLVVGPFLMDKKEQPPWQESGDWRKEFALD